MKGEEKNYLPTKLGLVEKLWLRKTKATMRYNDFLYLSGPSTNEA